jgi:hypothetical protein
MKPTVYKLTHSFAKEDSKIYFRALIPEMEICKIIKVWQYKLAEVKECTDFDEQSMMDVLKLFGCEQISENDSFRTYYEIDLPEIWEARNIIVTKEDMDNPKYNNDEANNILDRVVKANN